MFDCFAL
jgi:hypothetical protein